MLGLLSQPKPQSADTAIVTLCDRISHSLLIEDRKAAVLALRGLAHENRELVASLGLQGLLGVLIKDSHDHDSAKATLETLLILFNTDTRRKVRNRRYISPLLRGKLEDTALEPNSIVNDISLWLTDRLLHSEDALDCILRLTAIKNDAFTAVYALQLVSVMVANRPVEAKQALLVSGGVGPLVTALGSVQEMVRDEALLVLTALTADHLDLQKLVTFEGGFDKTFEILQDGGGVIFGGRFAEDCLALLANLIEYNTSNQKLFTQAGYVSQWTGVLQTIVDVENENIALRSQAVSNIEAALMIGQLLCVPGAEQTNEHQDVLCDSGALTLVLQIAFGSNSPPAVRVAALVTSAALVYANATRQNELLAVDVPYYDLTTRKVTLVEPRTVPVSQALLNWAVNLNATHLFDLRSASLICLSSALSGNTPAKASFVAEQIQMYSERAKVGSASARADGTPDVSDGAFDANLIDVLAEYSEDSRLNPFRIWFAAAILMRVFVDSPEIRTQLQEVTIGDADLGMEVNSLIQAITGEMQGSLQQQDPTVALGYLQLLSVWLYDDVRAVNEFLLESSAVQALLAHRASDPLVESLAVILLGIAYTFSSKDSPLPRPEFHALLTQTMGRNQFMLFIRKFRQSAIFQNYEESDLIGAPRNSAGSPAVYLDAAFVDLMRENLGYISRAIDANPLVEPSTRLTLEMHDEVKSILHSRSEELELAKAELKNLQEEYEQVKGHLAESDLKSSEDQISLQEKNAKLEQIGGEIKRLESENEKLKTSLSTNKNELESKSESLKRLQSAHDKLKTEFDTRKASQQKAEEGVNSLTRELFQLQRAKDSFEKDVSKLNSEVARLKPRLEAALKSEEEWKAKFSKAQADIKEISSIKEVNDKLVAKLKETASILKQCEEEEEQTKQELSKIKLEAEANMNELRSFKNREAAARKEVELAKAKIESLKKFEKEASGGNDSLNKEIAELKSTIQKLKSEVSSLTTSKAASDEKVAQLSMEIEKQRTESAARSAKAEKQVSDLELSQKKLKEVNMRLVSEISDLTKQPKAENSGLGGASTHLKEIDNLKSELDEKQSALDELLLLLDDLTEKKSSYKNRLREMKQEVSDSEAEGDDENEDDH